MVKTNVQHDHYALGNKTGPVLLGPRNIRKRKALQRFIGICGTDGILQTAGLSSTAWTASLKMELEGHILGVEMFRVSRSATVALDGEKMLVGVTESNDFVATSGFTASQNISAPIINGVAYPQIAPAGTVNGFQVVAWPGAPLLSLTSVGTVATATTAGPHGLVTGALIIMRGNDPLGYNSLTTSTQLAVTVTSTTTFTYNITSVGDAPATILGSYTANMFGTRRPDLDQSYAISQFTPLRSLNSRRDGGERPLFLQRIWSNGVARSFPFTGLNASLRKPSTSVRGRTFQVGARLADAVASPSDNFGIDAVFLDVFPIFTFVKPVLSVWGVFDSTGQQDGVVSDRISCAWQRACYTVSTMDKPVVYANFGASGISSPVYFRHARKALEAGAPPPSILAVGVPSVNDGASNDAIAQYGYGLAMDCLDLAAKYSIPVVVMVMPMPYNAMNAQQYGVFLQQKAQLQAIADAYGIQVLSFSGMGDGAYPERWIPSMNYLNDGLHPNELCIETVETPQIVAFLNQYT